MTGGWSSLHEKTSKLTDQNLLENVAVSSSSSVGVPPNRPVTPPEPARSTVPSSKARLRSHFSSVSRSDSRR
jgi:hypothetical protein